MNTVETASMGTNPGFWPHMHAWGWEIAAYLFLGGLVAGLMIVAGLAHRRPERAPVSVRLWAPLAAPVLLGIGLLALFLDLEHKAHFYRFYTAFRWTSPMSWGAWILAVVMPASLGMAWAALSSEDGDEGPAWRRTVAAANVVLGAALGIYTGVLLGTLGARPLWNAGVLPPLFLASGVSSALALLMLVEPDGAARRRLGSFDRKAIGIEAALLALLLASLVAGGAAQRAAADLLLGGEFTAAFWAVVVFAGLAAPVTLEWLAGKGRAQHSAWPALLVLSGGFALRAVILLAGQASRWEAL